MKRWMTFSLLVLLIMLANVGMAGATVVGDEPGGDLVVDADNYTITGDHQGTGAYNSITVGNGGILNIQPDDTADGAVIDVTGKVTVSGNSSIIAKGYYTISTSPNYNGRGVTINATDVQIDPGSKIDASDQGYPSGTGPGTGYHPDGFSQNSGGGGYGGKGGDGYRAGGPPIPAGGSPYGSASRPIDLGSGGGHSLWWYNLYGGTGGGAVELNISDTLTNNGSIDSNGLRPSNGPGGGGGGSVLINTGMLQGTGSFNANGGSGPSWGGGGGGGGRIAVFYRDKSGWTGSLSAAGGIGYRSGESGSLLFENSELAIASFSNQSKLSGVAPLKTGQSTSDNGIDLNMWVASESGSINLGFTPFVEVRPISEPFDDYDLVPGTNYFEGSLVFTNDSLYKATVTASNLSLGQYHWRARYKGPSNDFGPWAYYGATNIADASTDNEGADFEIGGNSPGSTYPDLTLNMTQNLINSQSPLAVYQNSMNLTGNFSLTFTDDTSINAIGPLTLSTGQALQLANGSSYNVNTIISGGSVILGDNTNASVFGVDLDRFTLNSGSLAIGSNTILTRTSDFTVGATGMASFTVGGNSSLNMPNSKLTISNNSSLVPKGYYTVSTSPNYDGRGVIVNAKDIQIDSGSRIDASNQGYGGGPGVGSRSVVPNGPGTGGGGGYGGNGGISFYAGTPYYRDLLGFSPDYGSSYGSAGEPIDLGSGGGWPSGPGGGAIKLIMTGTLKNNGTIASSGNRGLKTSNNYYYGGGASGGSIWVNARTLEGTGSISAKGGNTAYYFSGIPYLGGGGSGGRIAVYYEDKAGWTGSLSAAGGIGFESGANGSVIFQVPNPDLSSQSHLIDTWSNDNTIDIDLANGSSVVDGYSVLWSKDSPQDPPENINLQPDTTSTTSQPLEDGNWYFNISNKDNEGNWSASSNLGPFKIDKTSAQTTVGLNGTAGNNGWHTSDVTVTLTATDSGGSSVALTEYSFDDILWSDYTEPLTLTNEGTTTVYYRSTDNAGNIEPTKSQAIIIDKTAPTISGGPTSAPNANGWYADDVTVHFDGDDSLSGLASVTADTVVASEGADQQVVGTATDLAGNTSTLIVGNINIDKTDPTTTLELEGELGENGWYTGPVAVTVDSTDTGGETTIECTVDGQPWQQGDAITDDGTHTVTYRVTDPAGNVSESQETVYIDNTATITDSTQTSDQGDNGWCPGEVHMAFNAADAGSGVAYTEYDLNSSGWTTYTVPFVIDAEGINTLLYRSVDNAGNIEATQTAVIKIDMTPPQIFGQQSPDANEYGWNNTDVAVTFEASDAVSGLDSVTADTVIASEGADQQVVGTATDMAGNSVSATVSGINIDKTAPTISGTPTTQPNVNGWYQDDVTIEFSGTDGLSGIDTVTSDTVMSTEGANQSVTGTVVDLAGNSASATVAGINIDKTSAQTIDGLEGTTGDNGWYTSDVTVILTATDIGGSGVALTEYSFDDILWSDYTGPFTVGVEGTTTVYYRSTDNADNVEAANVVAFKIDKTAPTISGAPTSAPNANGWYAADVTVHFDASDALSGLASVTSDTIVSSETVNQQVIGTAIDNAGNSADYTVTGINIDKTSAQTTAGLNGTTGDNGWYTSDVTVTLTATDNGGSGVALTEYSFDDILWSDYTGPLTLTNESTTTVYYRSTDNADNVEATNSETILIDKTAPMLAVNSPVDQAEYLLNQAVIANWSASDSVSGIASATGDADSGQPVDTSNPGTNTFTVVVIDNAGNTTTETLTYYVRYDYGGILEPIEADGNSVFRMMSEGSVVPVKFQLKDANDDYAVAAVASISLSQTSEEVSGKGRERIVDEPVTPGINFLYDNITNEYYFNYDTDLLEEGTWEIRIDLDDETSKYATISIRE